MLRFSCAKIVFARRTIPFNFIRALSHKKLKMSVFSKTEFGCRNTGSYHLYITKDDRVISAAHDIPYIAKDDGPCPLYNMVVEIPRWTNAKMEINMTKLLTPIQQDVKNKMPRFVSNVFPFKGYPWNYGAIPQTWEDPNEVDEDTMCKGDNDPIDVIEIGSRVPEMGEVLEVKVLGCLALIDEGETDWKILAIDKNDELAEKMNDVSDIETHCPGLIKATVEWLKIYKIPDGKPANTLAFSGEVKDSKFAIEKIEKMHELWVKLMEEGAKSTNFDLRHSVIRCSTDSALWPDEVNKLMKNEGLPKLEAAAEVPPKVSTWKFVSSQDITGYAAK